MCEGGSIGRRGGDGWIGEGDASDIVGKGSKDGRGVSGLGLLEW